jgi:hypothetical protein
MGSLAATFLRLLPMAIRFGQWLLPVIGGIVTTWAAILTPALKDYAPFSYVVAALLGGVVVALVLTLMSWSTAALFRAMYYARSARPSDVPNPLDTTFTHRRIRLVDFCDPVTRVVHRKTFVECELIGPTVALFSGCRLIGSGGPLDAIACNFVLVRDSDRPIQYHGIVLIDCTLQDCKYLNLTMLFNDGTANDLDNRGGLPWLNNRPSSSPISA